uniref:VWFC domain-containing protein n=1 Tax=Hucho hucho TaxID=62062 RepID=A0A4W5KG75_9TELE
MECWVLLSLSLLAYLYLEVAGAGAQDHRGLAGQGNGRRRGPGGAEHNQPQGVGLGRGKRRKAGGPGKGRARGNRNNQRSNPPLGLTRLGSLPPNARRDGGSIFIESYKSADERQSNYNVIPGKKGQCVYQGITMFEKAVWSPKQCVTCLCSRGEVVCDEIICAHLRCHYPYTPTGECCPVCMDTGRCCCLYRYCGVSLSILTDLNYHSTILTIVVLSKL